MERAAGQRCPAALFRWLTEETWKLLAISNAVTPPGDGGGRGRVDRHEDPPRRQAERGRHGAEAGIDGLESGLGCPEQHRDGDEPLSQNHTGRGEQDFDAQCCQRTARPLQVFWKLVSYTVR